MTIKEAQRHGDNLLRRAGIQSNRIDTSLILEKVTGRPRSWLFAHNEEDLPEKAAREFMNLVSRRAERVPLVHLTNSREFYGLDFFINENVLTPRIETEVMVDLAVKFAPKNSSLIDVGTGSGAIAIAIKKHRPDLKVSATDITDEALAVASKNALAHETDIKIYKSDLLESVSGKYDTIVANLPYLKDDASLMPEVKKEPAVALFGGPDGLNLYRRLLDQLPSHLEKGGWLFTECDPWQQDDLIAASEKKGLVDKEKSYFILGFQLQVKGPGRA